jgi:hypothetical protein
VVTEQAVSADNLGGMSHLVDNIRTAIASPRGGRQVCLACGRRISASDQPLRLRGGAVVHRACGTYDVSRRLER